MNQTGVRQALIDEPKHNACWDSHLTPEGKVYFSVCSELTVGEYAKLTHTTLKQMKPRNASIPAIYS